MGMVWGCPTKRSFWINWTPQQLPLLASACSASSRPGQLVFQWSQGPSKPGVFKGCLLATGWKTNWSCAKKRQHRSRIQGLVWNQTARLVFGSQPIRASPQSNQTMPNIQKAVRPVIEAGQTQKKFLRLKVTGCGPAVPFDLALEMCLASLNHPTSAWRAWRLVPEPFRELGHAECGHQKPQN